LEQQTSNSQLSNKPIDYEEMRQVAGKSLLKIRIELLNNQHFSCTEYVNLSTITTTITFTSATCHTISTKTAAISRPSSSERAATRLLDAQKLLTKEWKTNLSPNRSYKRAVRDAKMQPY